MAGGRLGLESGVVLLVDHQPEWAELYDLEADRIRGALGADLLGIEHIGSTAVAALRAKPILDIMAGVADIDSGLSMAARLDRIGYEYANWGHVDDHVYANKGQPRTHLLHLVEYEGTAWKVRVEFRDALRSRPDLAVEYEKLKRDMALRFPGDRAAYSAAKAAFIRSARML